jgi:iron complex transport system substrate-binding protein
VGLLIALLASVVPTFAAQSTMGPRTFTDDLGRHVVLSGVPQRLVSLAPSITEILYAIGLGDRVVGVTEFCDYPANAQTKPKVGYSHPNVESILALHPDLVVAPSAFLRPDLLTKLEQLKIAIYISEPNSVEDIPQQIQMLGRMLDRSASADELAAQLRDQLSELNARTQGRSRPRVLYVLNSQPLITVGPGSFIHELIEMAGGTNVAARAASPYPRLSMEEVLAQDPQIIIFPVGNSEGVPAEEQVLWRRWNTMSAVKQGSFYRVGSNLLNRPGPRILLGLTELIRIIHPEVSLESSVPLKRP